MASFFQHILYLLLLSPFRSALGYVPASPTNDTSVIQATTNGNGSSRLHLQWSSNGSYWENVSYQLVGANSTGFTQGALVHFSERNVTLWSLPTQTPWIALVSCDYNATNAPQDVDVFTLAKDRGAVSSLLYSLYSAACIINPAYEDPEVFNQILDIFTTQSPTSAHLIEYQFGQAGTNESEYNLYDSQLLNQSFNSINESITTGNVVAPGYLLASLQAYNATAGPNAMDGDQISTVNQNNSTGNTGLAMIILYAITGCVSALFCVVIISGAIRAIRHPERYGPRVAVHVDGAEGLGQSRARGLTRAILDTFPIVKFGSPSREVPAKDLEGRSFPAQVPLDNDSRTQTAAMELTGLGGQEQTGDGESGDGDQDQPSEVEEQAVQGTQDERDAEGKDDGAKLQMEKPEKPPVRRHSRRESGNPETAAGHPRASSSSSPLSDATDIGEGTSRAGPSLQLPAPKEVVPAAIGRETCPICIVDFEEGDDLRQLPCEGKHRFHQQCVDPWLLELSSSCPICRQDFLALETMLSREPEEGERWQPLNVRRLSGATTQGNRFSRYLRYARLRHHRAREENDSQEPQSPEAEAHA